MTQRTTDDLVKETLAAGEDYDLDRALSLARYIKAATLLTNRVAQCAIDKGLSLNDEELAEIETWLAAYFYTRSDPIYQSKSTGGQSASFVADQKSSTERYKAGAMAVDPSGCVNAFLNNLRASSKWLGKNPGDQIDWQDR